jgi:hypothetical protein
MSEPAPSSSSADRRPFQFSLAAAFAVVTGLCIILSLVVWDPNRGSALAILTVGSFWSLAAVRSGYRRLAYHLASVSLGMFAYGLLYLPISPSTREVLAAWEAWPHWKPAVTMCLVTCLVALVLRPWIRRSGRVRPAVLGLVAVFLTATLFGYGCFVPPFSPLPVVGTMSVGDYLSVLPLIPVLALIIGAMSLHVAWPAAILFCVLLRWIDPEQ